jgi:hypothetical protein
VTWLTGAAWNDREPGTEEEEEEEEEIVFNDTLIL